MSIQLFKLAFVPTRCNHGAFGCATNVYLHKRNSTTSSAPIRKSLTKLDISQIKKGQGGRSSFSGIVATVFGSTGFLGRYVVNRLGRIGSQIIVPYRGDYYDAFRLKLAGDLGQVLFHPFDLKDEKSLYKAMKYSNVVINCLGKDYETSNWKFSDVHIDGARNIARIAKDCGVEKFIHVSAMNCAEHPKPVMLKKGSQFLTSKWYGEQAVKDEFEDAIIVRPSEMFGNEDRFLRYYCLYMRRQGVIQRAIPLWNKGIGIEKQPVYVGDVANGIINAVLDEDAVAKTFEAVGPRRYLLSEIIKYVFRVTKKDEDFKIVNMKYKPTFWGKVYVGENFFKYSKLSWERLEREHISDELTGMPGLEDLGVRLTNMEDISDFILKIFKDKNYYIQPEVAFEETPPPPVIS